MFVEQSKVQFALSVQLPKEFTDNLAGARLTNFGLTADTDIAVKTPQAIRIRVSRVPLARLLESTAEACAVGTTE